MAYLIVGLSLLIVEFASFVAAFSTGDWRWLIVSAICGFLVAGTLRG